MPKPRDHVGNNFSARRDRFGMTGAVPDFKPPRDVCVPVKNAVACPDCKAVIGDPCVKADGQPLTFVHRARRRMAVRLRNQQLGESA